MEKTYLYRIMKESEMSRLLDGDVLESFVDPAKLHFLGGSGFSFFTRNAWTWMHEMYDITMVDLLNRNGVATQGRELYRFTVTNPDLVSLKKTGYYDTPMPDGDHALVGFEEVRLSELLLSQFAAIEKWNGMKWVRIG